MDVGAETDGEAVGLGVVKTGVAVEPGAEGPVVGEGDAVLEQAACATMSAIASALPSGDAARFPEGARRQKLSACLRYGRGCIGPAGANRSVRADSPQSRSS